MDSSGSKNAPLIPGNEFTPSLTQAHIDKIFESYLKSDDPLYYIISVYLKNLCSQYFERQGPGRILEAIYQPDFHDVSMFIIGIDAPLSILVGVWLIQKRLKYRLIPVLTPAKEDQAGAYMIDINNRSNIFSTTINSADESTILKVFDSVLEKPLLPKEDYFLAGVETSKLLYQKAVEEVNLRFGTSKAG